jgi:hypothetical protein
MDACGPAGVEHRQARREAHDPPGVISSLRRGAGDDGPEGADQRHARRTRRSAAASACSAMAARFPATTARSSPGSTSPGLRDPHHVRRPSVDVHRLAPPPRDEAGEARRYYRDAMTAQRSVHDLVRWSPISRWTRSPASTPNCDHGRKRPGARLVEFEDGDSMPASRERSVTRGSTSSEVRWNRCAQGRRCCGGPVRVGASAKRGP